MIISPAFAQASGGAGGLSSLLPFLLIFVVFYFFLITASAERAKEHREMVNNVKRGDRLSLLAVSWALSQNLLKGRKQLKLKLPRT